MRTAEEFKAQLRKRNITEWFVSECEQCKQPLRYLFFSGEPCFNMDCNCTDSDSANELPVSWEDIAKHYNSQTNPAIITAMDIFWGFQNVTKTVLFNPPKTNPF